MAAVRRYGYLAVAVVGLGGVAGYFSLVQGAADGTAAGSAANLVWVGLAALTVVAVLAGAALHRPPAASAWLVLAGAVALSGAGDLLVARPVLIGRSGTGQLTSPSVVDAVYLASSAVLFVAVLVLVRRQSPGRDRSAALDTLIVTTAAALVTWVFLVEPVLPQLQGSDGVPAAAVTLAYPVMDLLVLSAAARLWFAVDAGRNGSLRLLVASLAALLVADGAYSLQSMRGTWEAGTLWDLGWFGFYLGIAVAATHPSAAAAAVATSPQQRVSIWRLVLLFGLVSLVPPVLLLGQAELTSPTQAVVVLLGAGTMFGLAVLRMHDLALQLRETLRREGVIRGANAALAAAPDRAGIRRSTVEAARAALPGSRAWWVEARGAAGGPGAVVAAAPSSPGQQVGAQVVEMLERTSASETTIVGPGPVHVALELPTTAVVVVYPLHDDERAIGHLVVASDPAPSTEARTALASLSDAASLAHARVDLGRVLADRQSERRLRRMMQHASDIIAVLDLDLGLRYLSPAAERLMGTPTHYLLGKSWLELVFPVDREPARQLITQALGDRPSSGEVRLMSSDGSHRYVELSAARVVEDEEPGFVLTCHDVTDRRALEHQLTHQAFHDSLTGLANRALFRDRLELAQTRSHRTGAPFAVLFVDLDDFKNVNDTLGHAAGDAMLRQVTHRLLDAVRDQDTVARLGGDEFAVVLEDLAGEEEAIQVAERFLSAMDVPFDVTGSAVASGVSIGIAVSAAGPMTADDAMRNADLALYEAKNLGKNQYALFIPMMHELAVDRMQLTGELRRAIGERELTVHYQPIVDLELDRTVGVEALVRWRHPTRGLIGPAQFIPLAEETGLVVPLGRDILRQALGTVGKWQRRLPAFERLYVSVNLSARQLQQDTVVDDVRFALAESGVRPQSVILEITETVLLPDEGVTLERLQSLNALGVRLFIDDFGTGYSSLSYLQQLPVHGIKLAQEFVATLRDPATTGSSPGSGTGLVATIRALAETLGLESIIAEGVETPEQRDALLALGYRLGQGFLMARPMPADAMLERLSREAGRLSGVGLVAG